MHNEIQYITITTMRNDINNFLLTYKSIQNNKNTANMNFLPVQPFTMPTYKTLNKQIDKSHKVLTNDDAVYINQNYKK